MTGFEHLHRALANVEYQPSDGFARIVAHAKSFRQQCQFFFIGNGGSAAIADHMAADWTINGGFAAHSLSASALTCAANDHGVEEMFAWPLQNLPRDKFDCLFAISSSGRSKNILKAVEAFRARGLPVVTLSGFDRDNELRKLGYVNFYVPSSRYGIVETCHLAILHAILDKVMETKE